MSNPNRTRKMGTQVFARAAARVLGAAGLGVFAALSAACAGTMDDMNDSPTSAESHHEAGTTFDGDTLKPKDFLVGPSRVPCWFTSGNEGLSLGDAYPPGSGVWVYGRCFNGGTDYVLIYDESTGLYVTGNWIPVTAQNDGTLFLSVPGWFCHHTLAMTGYDTVFGHLTQTWEQQVPCAPR